MRIYDRDLTGAAPAEAGRSAEAQKLGREGGLSGSRQSGGEGNDRVEFSNNLERLSRAMTSFGAQQANRVQELSTLYDSGQYKVEAAAVSKAMVESALAAAPE